jgi:hypothetical protein
MPDILLTIKTQADKAVGELKKFTSGLLGVEKQTTTTQKVTNALSGSYTELMSGLALIDKGLGEVQKVYNETIGKTVEYAATVRQMSLISGASTEETSRMIQMTDDLGVEIGALEVAMRAASTRGIVLTTESLAKQSDEYLKLAPGIERNTYLTDLYGARGLEMAKVLAKGSKEIIAMSNAVADNMVMTQESIDQAREYEIALDNLNDSITGVKYNLGNGLIPAVTKLIDVLNSPSSRTAAEFINTAFKGTFIESDKSKIIRANEQAIDNLSRGYRKMGDAIQATKKVTQDYSYVMPPLTTDILLQTKAIREEREAAELLGSKLDGTKKIQEGLTTIWGLASSAVSKLATDELQRARIEDALAIASGKLTQEDINRREMVMQLTQAYIDGKMGRDEYINALTQMGKGAWSLLDAEQKLLELNGQVSNVTFTINGQRPEDFYRNYGIGPGWGSGTSPGSGPSIPTPPGSTGGGTTPPPPPPNPRFVPDSGGVTNVIINGWQGNAQTLAAEIDRQNKIRELMQ